jgi:hypothetical protein
MREILLSPPLSVAPEDFAKVDLVLFMSMQGRYPLVKRRVSAMHESDGKGSHRRLFEYNGTRDEFTLRLAGENAKFGRYKEFIQSACTDNLRDDRKYREAVLDFYKSLE